MNALQAVYKRYISNVHVPAPSIICFIGFLRCRTELRSVPVDHMTILSMLYPIVVAGASVLVCVSGYDFDFYKKR